MVGLQVEERLPKMKRILLYTIILQSSHQSAHSLSSPSTPQQPVPVHTLLLCRHGDSIWNGGQPGTQETFTGWTDVPLSQKGIAEARNTATELALLYPHGIDACFTSILGRARETAHYCHWAFDEKPQSPRRYISDYRLNERHYGALQGYVKAHVEQGLYGHDYEMVQAWRRSWYAVPPLLDDDDPRRIREVKYNSNFCGGEENVPRGESLEMVANDRIRPFLDEVLHPLMSEAAGRNRKLAKSLIDARHGNISGSSNADADIGGCGLVVAHANSLRALIGVICQVESNPSSLKKLEAMKIQTGVPLILKYRQLEDGSYEACDLAEASDDFNTGNRSAPNLPVWPLSCIPKKPHKRHQFHYSRSIENEKKFAENIRSTASNIRIDVI